MIELSVRMPMFRAKYIAWLAFESLCRQTGIDFEWELIMAEEQLEDEVFGAASLKEYAERLADVGCSRIHYIPLQTWIPLARKMCLLVEHCSEESKYVAFQSADYYSAPGILAAQYKAFTEDPERDWFAAEPYTIFYDIETGISKMIANGPNGSGRAVKLEIVRLVGPTDLKKNCDKWFYRSCYQATRSILQRDVVEYSDEEQWKYAFNVHGFHNCSIRRGESLRLPHKKWLDVPFDWKANIPNDILQRVYSLKEFIPKHIVGPHK